MSFTTEQYNTASQIVKDLKLSGVTLIVDGSEIKTSSTSLRGLTQNEVNVIEQYKDAVISVVSDSVVLIVGTEEQKLVDRPTTTLETIPILAGATFGVGVNSINDATGDVDFEYVSSVCGNTGDVSVVCTFNGATGAIVGVNSVNGLTGAVTLTDLVGVATFNGLSGAVEGVGTFNGATGAITGVNSWNGLTGAVNVTSAVIHVGGISSDAGATFGGSVIAPTFVGALTGNVTGNASGTSATVTTAAQGAITSVGTLTALTMGGELSCVDNLVTRPVLKDYAETVNAIGTITSATAISFEDGNVQTVTGNGNCEFTFTNPPASGKAGTVTLIITNGGANTTTWHSSVKWPGNNAPALTASGVDVVSFMTIDAGTTIYGFVGGINFS